MEKFTHIESFYHVVKHVSSRNRDENTPKERKINRPVIFRGTVKLHGSNCGVACSKDKLQPQSRNRTISVEKDNLGFAKFVSGEKQTKAIREIESEIRFQFNIDSNSIITLYGEWVGPGIHKGVAINKLPEKQWVLFAVKSDNKYIDAVPILFDKYSDANIFSIEDSVKFIITVDFNNQKSKETALEYVTQKTNEVEKQCPWGAKFGCEGIGEGIVLIPIEDQFGRQSLYWKSKGKKHKITEEKNKKQNLLDQETINSISEFVSYAVTENRLNQGLDYLREMNLSTDSMKSTGNFIKWVSQDIKRECELELKENNLEWKMVVKEINYKISQWFKSHVEKI